MNKKIWKISCGVGVLFLTLAIFFRYQTEKFKADYQKVLNRQDVAVQLIARKLHLLGEDRAFQESLAQNLTYALSQSMERYIDPEDFTAAQILNKNGQTVIKVGNWKTEQTMPVITVGIRLDNGYYLQGLCELRFDLAFPTRPFVYLQFSWLSLIILVFSVLSSALFVSAYIIRKLQRQLLLAHQNLQQVQIENGKMMVRDQRLAQDFKTQDIRIQFFEKENTHLKVQQVELQKLRIFAEQLNLVFDSLRAEQHSSDQHIHEALHFLKTDMAMNAKNLFLFSDRWNKGMKLEGNSELGPRKFFKQLSEQRDLVTGQSQLEIQLADLQAKTEKLNDEVMQSCLQIAAIKNLKTSTLQFFDHWKAFLNPAVSQKSSDVILCFKEAEKMVRSCTFDYECDFQSIVISGFLNFKTPQASRPILTSVFFHTILALLYESEGSSGLRTIKPVVQVKQTAQRLILSCFFSSQLRLNHKNKMALDQWIIVHQLLAGTDLTIERLPPAANLLSLVIQWDAHKKEEKDTSLYRKTVATQSLSGTGLPH